MKRSLLAILAVGMVVAVSCNGGEETSAEGDDAGPAATATPGTPSEGGATDGEDSSPSQGESSSEGGSSPDPSTGGVASGSTSGAAVFAKAGTYRYATEGTTKIGELPPRDLPEETTLVAKSPSGDTQTFIRDLRDDEGNGTLTETDLVYRGSGVYLSRIKATSNFQGGGADVRELEPSKPELVLPAKDPVGFTTSFKVTGDGVTADVTLKILRTENVGIGGQSVEAIVTELKVIFSGEVTGTQRSTSWFSLKNSLLLKEDVSGDVQNGVIRVQTDYKATLKSLTP